MRVPRWIEGHYESEDDEGWRERAKKAEAEVVRLRALVDSKWGHELREVGLADLLAMEKARARTLEEAVAMEREAQVRTLEEEAGMREERGRLEVAIREANDLVEDFRRGELKAQREKVLALAEVDRLRAELRRAAVALGSPKDDHRLAEALGYTLRGYRGRIERQEESIRALVEAGDELASVAGCVENGPNPEFALDEWAEAKRKAGV